jgi:hypothetical protein
MDDIGGYYRTSSLTAKKLKRDVNEARQKFMKSLIKKNYSSDQATELFDAEEKNPKLIRTTLKYHPMFGPNLPPSDWKPKIELTPMIVDVNTILHSLGREPLSPSEIEMLLHNEQGSGLYRRRYKKRHVRRY